MIHDFESSSLSSHEIRSGLTPTRFFDTLPAKYALQLTQAGSTRHFCAQTNILQAGTQPREVYVIKQGLVSVGLFQDRSPALCLYVSGPGTIVDLYALLDPPIAPVTVHALTDVEALAIPCEVLKGVLAKEPACGYEVMKALCTRLSLIAQVAVSECLQSPPSPSWN